VYLYHRVHFPWHALAENKQRSGWQFGGRERREAGRKARDEQHDVTLPVAVSVADRKQVTVLSRGARGGWRAQRGPRQGPAVL
jgi:hypothetical protein